MEHLYEKALESAEYIKAHTTKRPKVAVVLGSGLGNLTADFTDTEELPYKDIPNFPVSTVAGHKGALLAGRLGEKEVYAQTLEAGIQEIRKLSGTLPLLGCAMLESALARKESRGAHWRADYPQRNDAVYCKTTVAHWNGQHIAISFESIPERRHDL